MVDIGVAGAVLAVPEVAIATGREADSASRDWLAYLLGMATAAPLLLRRRFPVATLYIVSAALLLFYALGSCGMLFLARTSTATRRWSSLTGHGSRKGFLFRVRRTAGGA